MEQQNAIDVGEGSEDRSGLLQASSSSQYPTPGQSSEIVDENADVSESSSSHSGSYSTRIHDMIQNRSNFTSEVEIDIAYSRDHHWSDLVDSDTDSESLRAANAEHFQELKNHPQWGAFFMSVKLEVGEMINEGAQAEIYDAIVEFEDGRKSPGFGYHVVKVMKGDNPLQDFQRQWPVGMLSNASKERVKGPLMWILGGTMIGNWFAFIMQKQWGDLRKLIDAKMQLDGNQGPPKFEEGFLLKILLCVARDMDALHTEHDIIHRDLKASNILLWSLGEGLPCDNPHVKANVADYECSVGVVGTRFWRAPEILQQLKDRVQSSKLVFTKAADVYSYGMVCYELLYGRIPYEEHPPGAFDAVLSGGRPLGLPRRDFLMCNQHEAQEYFHTQRSEQESQEYYEGTQDPVPSLDSVPSVKSGLHSVMQLCWNHEPSERPTFSEIVKLLESKSLETTRVQRMRFGEGREPVGYRYHVAMVMKRGNRPQSDIQQQWPVGMLLSASKDGVEGPLRWGPDRSMICNGVAFMMPKQWGDLRKLIDVKMQLGGNKGPPEFQEDFLLKVLLCVARDMDTLHTKHEIIHEDLKASNILVWLLGEGLPCDDPQVRANVVGYEYSMERTDLVFGGAHDIRQQLYSISRAEIRSRRAFEIMRQFSMRRTDFRFLRAPEIRQQLEDGVWSSELVFTKEADVYNYGTVCYELLTGSIPYEDLPRRLEDVLNGDLDRPARVRDTAICMEENAMDYFIKRLLEPGSQAYLRVTKDSLPSFCFSSNVRTALFSVMLLCWNHEPSERPTFSEIVELLEPWKV